ncbi:phosphonate C-P lyase system protein PhnH [Glaciimonas sp. CA11.2]|uniref:phosphonate C-P lyase system protein PhnH n=1 Tax=unclassified Glaciimonas TaxID=2644401 RepID=UPI002AB414FD|nr:MULTISPECIES: phosphonate C-P lyase system protein PhnH [unclassified Glaciimonas]MDY7546322.1 phosphonate C-P lyase system protein PhnH [Glaciimonas sp. CA11.2]MEB0010729.1 phosphonate C-P lyase system protein PhnH [Glaciimonas sp. Cout2]MEB0082135.1 phosphonate C-P lyase system protein PhnH [Glaciimonas sp. Gout2]MEB0161771.1 phosphonate C-P lyase system protein PhnH [Glaciimonas sp. CA11.2]
MSAVFEATLLPAWNDPVHDAQSTFRAVLKALSEPGSIQTVVADIPFPAPLFLSTTALCLALADVDTAMWLDVGANSAALNAYLRFHCGCRLVEDGKLATFAVMTDPLQLAGVNALEKFAIGTMEYPDRSTTLFVQVPSLIDGPQRSLFGPGIAHQRVINVAGLPENFDAIWQKNIDQFPLGIDLIFCHGSQMMGLPRTTNIANWKP